MGRLALLGAFALSLSVPLALRLEAGSALSLVGTEVSATALVLTVWVALAGLPRRAREPSGTGAFAVLGLALPVVALAFGADRAAGRVPAELATTAGVGLALVALLAAAADRGRPEGSPYGAAWFALVPLLALAPAFAGWGRGAPEAWIAATPLGWVFLRAGSPAGAEAAPALIPLALALALLALGGLGTGDRGEGAR